MNSSYPDYFSPELAETIASGGNISFEVSVRHLRTKCQILRQALGAFRSRFGLWPVRSNGFTVFEKPGTYRVIGIDSQMFYLSSPYGQSSDFGSQGPLPDEAVAEYAEKAGLIVPPSELAFLIVEQQPIGRIEGHYLNPLSGCLQKSGFPDFDDRFCTLVNEWNQARNKYEISLSPMPDMSAFELQGKKNCFHLFLAPPAA